MQSSTLLRVLSLALTGRDAFAFLAPAGPLCAAAGYRSLHAHESGLVSPALVAVQAGRRRALAAAVDIDRKQLPALRMGADRSPPGEKTKNLGSYYRRPSAAVEQGGGFFVPGLQGFRLRLVLAVITLGLISLDGFSRPGMTISQVVSEALAGLAGLALLVQALLDQRKEQAVQMRREAIASASATQTDEDEDALAAGEGQVSFLDAAALGSDREGRVRWAADILLQLTAGCSFVVFSKGKVLARAGDAGGESDDPRLLAAAFERAAGQEQGCSTIIKRAPSSRENTDDGLEGVSSASSSDRDDATMQLLPAACRQAVLCRVSPAPGGDGGGGGGGAVGGDVVVVLGSTLAGSGVFSGMDGAWFERVCLQIAFGASVA